MSAHRKPIFYTVAEAAELLRVDRATLYRAIRSDGFPAVRIRSRYVVPASAIEQLAEQAAESGGCIDVAALAAERRTARDVLRLAGGGCEGAKPACGGVAQTGRRPGSGMNAQRCGSRPSFVRDLNASRLG